MGVHSFWDIVGPAARPVRLESLQDKRMAVDASIWIYQFLKAVRDQEGNALRNSHVVGFFRRICKLLFFGIKPVFVFDGGVPVLKRQTIKQRKERRQGKRDSAAKTARKLLAIQLQKQQEQNQSSQPQTKQQADPEIFKPQDEWDLPLIPGFKYDQDDQRIVSEESFKNFQKSVDDELDNIDLDSINPASAEFEELPKSTQYLILSTLRLRSRLRLGYSKEQLEELFPNSMDFSKFQVDMVKRRNFFTQKLMGVTGTHDGGASKLDDEIVNRISGQRQKEYKLTKTDNGWILGLGDLDGSENAKAIVLDDKGLLTNAGRQATQRKISAPEQESNEEEEESSDWEDVDIKPTATRAVEDYSIKAARLPKLNRESNYAGSQSFLDKRYDYVSPVKKTAPINVARVVEEVDEDGDDDDDEEEERIFEKHLQEIKMMEAVQKSKADKQKYEKTVKHIPKQRSVYDENLQRLNAGEGKDTINAFGTKAKSQPNAISGTPKPLLTENEEALKSIVSKIPDFNFGESSSFLFERSNDSERMDSCSDKKEGRVQETPAWFQPTTGKKENPFNVSNFVADKEMPKNNDHNNFKLVTGLDAQEMIHANKNKEDEVEIIDSESEMSEKIDKGDQGDAAGVNSADSSIDEEIVSTKSANRPMAFDYDFSEEEEDAIVENMRKEEQEFDSFKNTLNNRVVDNAFMEDELYQQQVREKRDSDEVTTDMIVEVQDLLSRFGIPYITAPMEAEAQCAELLKLKLVDGIITDDSDVFLFGGTKIYKNMFHERNYVEFYDVDAILGKLGLERKNMIDLAQLLGSDYTSGLKSMGPVSSMEVIAEFGTLEKFRNWYNEGQFDKKKQEGETKFQKDLRRKLVKNEVVLETDFPSDLVRESYLHPEVDHDKTSFVWGTPDLDMLRVFMQNRIGWTQEKTDQILIPLIRDINNRKKQSRQMTITEFFPTEYIEHDKNKNFGKRIAHATGKLKYRRLK